MKYLLSLLVCVVGLLVPTNVESAFVLKFHPYPTHTSHQHACWLIQQFGPPAAQQQATDPSVIAALATVVAQQKVMSDQLTALNAQLGQQRAPAPLTTDPSLAVAIARLSDQLSAQQDRVIAAIQSGKVADQTPLLREMIDNQHALLDAVRNLKLSCPNSPPVVVTPSSPASPPPVVVVSPPTAGGTTPGGPLQTLPSAGGPIQVLPGPGGSLQVLPPAGGTLQSLPGPGGSIQLLPGGVKPPDVVKPNPAPPTGGIIQQLPGGGGIQVIPLPGDPMTPLPQGGGSLPPAPSQSKFNMKRYAVYYYPPGALPAAGLPSVPR